MIRDTPLASANLMGSFPTLRTLFSFPMLSLATQNLTTAELAAVPWPPPLSSLRIIAADDEPINAKVLEAHLRRLGTRARFVLDGQQLLRAMQSETFDLVLTDLCMPVLDGFTAVEHLRQGAAGEHHRQVPVVAITALVLEECHPRCRAVGINAVTQKPLRSKELLDAIHNALQQARREEPPV